MPDRIIKRSKSSSSETQDNKAQLAELAELRAQLMTAQKNEQYYQREAQRDMQYRNFEGAQAHQAEALSWGNTVSQIERQIRNLGN